MMIIPVPPLSSKSASITANTIPSRTPTPPRRLHTPFFGRVVSKNQHASLNRWFEHTICVRRAKPILNRSNPHDRIDPIKPSERLRIPTSRARISSNTIHHQYTARDWRGLTGNISCEYKMQFILNNFLLFYMRAAQYLSITNLQPFINYPKYPSRNT